MKTRRGLASLAVVGAASLAVAGCGSSAGGSQTSVKIGVLEPMSGPFAQNGLGSVHGIQLCADQINSRGGIRGYHGAKIKLEIKDTGQASPGQVANQMQSLISSGGLTAVMGDWASSYTLAASTVAEQAQVPMLTDSFSDEITDRGYRYIFKIPPGATELGAEPIKSILKLAKRAGTPIGNAVVIADNTSTGTVSGDAAAKVLKDSGVKVPVRISFTPGLTDAGSFAVKALGAHPGLVFLQGGVGDVVLLQKALVGQGFHGLLLGAGAGFLVGDYGKAAGAASEGTMSSAGWNWDIDNPEAEKFSKAYMKRYPDEAFPPPDSGEMCAATYMVAAAVAKAQSTEPKKVRNALAQLQIDSGPATMIAGGKVSFGENGEMERAPVLLLQWQGGKLRSIAPSDIAAAKPLGFS